MLPHLARPPRLAALMACGALWACPAPPAGVETRVLTMLEEPRTDAPDSRVRVVVLSLDGSSPADIDPLTDRLRTARPDVVVVEDAPVGSRDHESLLIAIAGATELRHVAWLPHGRHERWLASRWPIRSQGGATVIGEGSGQLAFDDVADVLRWDCIDDVGRAPEVENAAESLRLLVCPPWEVVRAGSGDNASVLHSDMLRLELGRVAEEPGGN